MPQVVARHRAMAGSGGEQAAQHLEGGGLARAVGAEQAVDLAARDGEIHVARGGEIAEALGQGVGLDRGHVARRDHAIAFGQRAGPFRAAAQDFDEPVLEARGGGGAACAGAAVQRVRPRNRAAFAHQQAHRPALDRAVGDVGPVERLLQEMAAARGKARHLDHPAFHSPGKVARRPLEQQPAVIQQIDAVALLGFVEIGGGPQYADAFAGQFLHHRPQFAARDRVYAHARFVEQHQLRRADQRAGQAQLLLHPARKPARQPVLEPGEVGEGKQAGEGLLPLLGRQGAQLGIKVEILAHRQVFVEAEALGHVAELLQHRSGRAAHDRHFAFVGREQPGQHADQRGLARAVRADEAGDRSRLHRDGDAVQRGGGHALEALDEVRPGGDRFGHRVRLSGRWLACPRPSPSPAGPGAARRRDRSR